MMGELFTLSPSQFVLAFVLDLLVGDPKGIPHPIVGIGKLILLYERGCRKIPYLSAKAQGILFFFAVVSTTFLLSILLTQLLKFGSQITLLCELLFIFLISQFLALKSLIKAGVIIEGFIKEENMDRARFELKALVGRDTDKLHKRDIERAILESYAENLNDAVVAPLFWLFLLGFPGIILYKTINTLDSMVGYKNEKYYYFGWFSAKTDDIINYLPARITALLIILSATLLLGIKTGFRALKTTLRYAKLHPSPNSGYPESALAGALGVRLLGPSYYEGKLLLKPYLGEDLLSNLEGALSISRKILYLSSFLWVSLLTFLLWRLK